MYRRKEAIGQDVLEDGHDIRKEVVFVIVLAGLSDIKSSRVTCV